MKNPSEICPEYQTICHRAETEDGKSYYCGECGTRLSGPNVMSTPNDTGMREFWQQDDKKFFTKFFFVASSEYEKLLSERDIAMKALEFYADINKYQNVHRENVSGDHLALVPLDMFKIAQRALDDIKKLKDANE